MYGFHTWCSKRTSIIVTSFPPRYHLGHRVVGDGVVVGGIIRTAERVGSRGLIAFFALCGENQSAGSTESHGDNLLVIVAIGWVDFVRGWGERGREGVGGTREGEGRGLGKRGG